VNALAIDVEPVVFWDGTGAAMLVEAWKQTVSFREGDERGAWGRVSSSGNGTSGATLRDEVLVPLNLDATAVWFSDAVPWYFVKRSSGPARRGQGDAIESEYVLLPHNFHRFEDLKLRTSETSSNHWRRRWTRREKSNGCHAA
jgi:hypothetical protein